ncbi:MAG: YciI family protein [Campylobacteraceae bacterium]|nr:YciI family protein [Campylobacteraceae bacterium]
MHYLLIYEAVEDYMTRRDEFRKEHLKLAADAQRRGEIVLAGALGTQGSAFLFLTEDTLLIEKFVKNDPYFKGGLIRSYKILPWNTVIGKDAQNPIKTELK